MVPCLGDIYAAGPTVVTVHTPQRKFLDIAISEVSGVLSMHVAPSAIRTVVVPVEVTVLLGLRNPPRGWTGTVGPSLPDFPVASCVDSLLCYRLIKQPKSILQDNLKV
jgi:hypothetical protein